MRLAGAALWLSLVAGCAGNPLGGQCTERSDCDEMMFCGQHCVYIEGVGHCEEKLP